MTTVLFIGDQHFKTTNIPEVELFISKITDLAKDKCPDLIILGGDLLDCHERLHTFPLNKAYELINNMRKISKTYVLVGNHDYCLGKDVSVMLLDGNIKMSQEIKKGDKLIGDDGKCTTVINTTYGKSKMYTIKQKEGEDYIVNENHILSLCFGKHKDNIFWNTTTNSWVVKWIDGKDNFKIKYKFFKVPTENTTDISKNINLKLNAAIDFIYESNVIDIPLKLYLQLNVKTKDMLYGFKLNKTITKIYIEENEIGEYYGFETDNKNHRFLLGDYTVTHNCNNQQYLSENHWLNSMKEWDNTIIVDKVVTEKINDQVFVLVPYVPPCRFEEALNTLDDENKTDWKKANCIFAHQEFFGCKMGAITSVEGDKWPLDYPEVVSGHIHSKQRPQKNIYYSGSAMQHAFGESTKNIIAHFTFIGNKYNLDEIDLNLPRKKIIYMDIENIEDYTAPESDDKIKITVSGSYDQFKSLKKTQKYKKLIDKGLKVVFKSKKIDHKEDIPETVVNETAFSTILSEIINKKKDNYLYETYELVVNNKEINNKDIMYF